MADRSGSGGGPTIGASNAPQLILRYNQKLAGGLELREARAGAPGRGGLRGRMWSLTFWSLESKKALSPPEWGPPEEAALSH